LGELETKGPRLLLRRGSEEATVFPLVLKETLLGRIDSNHVMLDHPSVSRVHARIFQVGEAIEIEDCGSAAGTLVNGHPIDRAKLRDGDEIKIGNIALTYADGEGAGH
jgi:pSer/pThr/pTyr-binding forkhead associated (FHA) protein